MPEHWENTLMHFSLLSGCDYCSTIVFSEVHAPFHFCGMIQAYLLSPFLVRLFLFPNLQQNLVNMLHIFASQKSIRMKPIWNNLMVFQQVCMAHSYSRHYKMHCFTSTPLTLSIGPFWNTWGSSQTTQYSFNTGIRCSANSIVWEQWKWE